MLSSEENVAKISNELDVSLKSMNDNSSKLKDIDYTDAVSVMEVVDSVETLTTQTYSVIAENNKLIIRVV